MVIILAVMSRVHYTMVSGVSGEARSPLLPPPRLQLTAERVTDVTDSLQW